MLRVALSIGGDCESASGALFTAKAGERERERTQNYPREVALHLRSLRGSERTHPPR